MLTFFLTFFTGTILGILHILALLGQAPGGKQAHIGGSGFDLGVLVVSFVTATIGSRSVQLSKHNVSFVICALKAVQIP